MKAARQRPIHEVEAAKIKRQMDYERVDKIEAPKGRARASKLPLPTESKSAAPETDAQDCSELRISFRA